MTACIRTAFWAALLAMAPLQARAFDDEFTFEAADTQASAPAPAPASDEPTTAPPPPAAKQPEPPPPSQTVEDQGWRDVPAGQWVYTDQYGWIWMPYGDAYTYVPPTGAIPDMYVYYPTVGWCWVVAPWVWGWGPVPYWGVYGYVNFGWYGHGYGRWYGFAPGYAHYGPYGHGYWHGGRWHGVAGGYAGYSRTWPAPRRSTYAAPTRSGSVGGVRSYAPRLNAAPYGGFSGRPGGGAWAAPHRGFSGGGGAAIRGGGGGHGGARPAPARR